MLASDWNSRYPRGAKVRFWPRGKNSADKPIQTESRAIAYLGSGALIIPHANGRDAKATGVESVVKSPTQHFR
jgi:hypothetical protein